jgi:citrate/tricarballylate utilization protein
MQQLDSLAREAVALAQGGPFTASEAEVGRQMQICNACRYCEGFCAVFPAMTRRLDFSQPDIHYLASLCHNCGACLHACQYAPPHEFAVNVPKAMAQVRVQSYADFAWPSALGALYRRNGLVLALATAIGLALFLVLLLRINGTLAGQSPGANFYAVFPHNTLVLMFGAAFAFAVLALSMSGRAFWRGIAPPSRGAASAAHATEMRGQAAGQAAHDALTLKYLDGGHGDGCNEASDAFTLARRRFHHATFYGFMLCFAATCVATLYHYAFGWHAPYAIDSLPVLLGTVGGAGLLIGPAGLMWLNLHRNPAHGDPRQKPMDLGFIALLFVASLTGLVLLLWRDGPAMPWLLAVHLGVVMALFLTLPYGKFAHAVYRCAALLKYQIERRQPKPLGAGAE